MPQDQAERRTVLNTRQARAGEASGRMWRVLSISLAGTILALAVVWAIWILLR